MDLGVRVHSFLEIAGLTCIGAIGVGAILFGLAMLLENVESLYNNWKYEHSISTIHEIGKQIKREKYWYSESKEAMCLLEVLGDAYVEADSPYVRMSTIRDLWRSKLDEQNKTEKQVRNRTPQRGKQKAQK